MYIFAIQNEVYGYTYSCESCAKEFLEQWDAYESERIPQSKRKYNDLVEKLSNVEDFEDPEGRPTLVSAQSLITAQSPTESEKCPEKSMECYICARVLQSKHKVYTHPGLT